MAEDISEEVGEQFLLFELIGSTGGEHSGPLGDDRLGSVEVGGPDERLQVRPQDVGTEKRLGFYGNCSRVSGRGGRQAVPSLKSMKVCRRRGRGLPPSGCTHHDNIFGEEWHSARTRGSTRKQLGNCELFCCLEGASGSGDAQMGQGGGRWSWPAWMAAVTSQAMPSCCSCRRGKSSLARRSRRERQPS